MAALVHLVRRFVESIGSRSPNSADHDWVRTVLDPVEFELWATMQSMDKRHSIGVARRLVASAPYVERVEIAIALLHDVGKVKSSLGVGMRCVATLIGPRTDRFREYRDHERIGALMCRDRGLDGRICDGIEGKGPIEQVERLSRADDL